MYVNSACTSTQGYTRHVNLFGRGRHISVAVTAVCSLAVPLCVQVAPVAGMQHCDHVQVGVSVAWQSAHWCSSPLSRHGPRTHPTDISSLSTLGTYLFVFLLLPLTRTVFLAHLPYRINGLTSPTSTSTLASSLSRPPMYPLLAGISNSVMGSCERL